MLAVKDERVQRLWTEMVSGELGLVLMDRGVQLHHAYLLILTLARSQNDIERLHNLLPRNCQLFGDDISQLKRIRSNMYDGNPHTDGKRPDDSTCRKLLEIACEGHSMSRWYYTILSKGRESTTMREILEREIVFSHVDRQGHGGEHFRTSIFKGKEARDLDLGVYISKDMKTIGIRLVTWECYLNKQFTDRAKQTPALMSSMIMKNQTWSTDRGGLLDFWFEFDAEEFVPLMEKQPRDEKDPRYGKEWVVKPGFIEMMQEKLEEIGLDLAPIIPILPAVE